MVKGTKGTSTMVKGTKRKISIEKITNKNSLATCFTKRRDGLYSKASQICLLSGAQMAVLAAPLSSQSNVSFFSFGHSSVDAVVSAFLAGQRPVTVLEDNKQSREDIGICLSRKDLGLGFWWEDEKFDRSESLEEVKEAVESMSILLKEVRSMKNQDFDKDLEKKKTENKDVVLHQKTTQTLNLECNDNKTEEHACVTDHNDKPFGNLEEWDDMEIDQLVDLLSDETHLKSIQPNCNDSLTTETKNSLDEWDEKDIDELLNLFSDQTEFKSIQSNCNDSLTTETKTIDCCENNNTEERACVTDHNHKPSANLEEWDEKDIDELLDLFPDQTDLKSIQSNCNDSLTTETKTIDYLDDETKTIDYLDDEFEINFEGLVDDLMMSTTSYWLD